MNEEPKWNIRLIQLNDLDNFYPFFEKSLSTQFPEYTVNTRQFFLKKDYPLEKISEIITKQKHYIFIALDEEKIIGYLLGNRVYGGVGFCEWLAVADEYHSRGVGTALLNNYEAIAKKDGAHKVELWTADKNKAYYEKKGYSWVGRVPANYFGADDNLMYKVLQEPKEENYLLIVV